jgi:hypothetical protein
MLTNYRFRRAEETRENCREARNRQITTPEMTPTSRVPLLRNYDDVIETLTETALLLKNDITEEKFREVGRMLKACHDCSKVWLGDWHAQGELIFGEKVMQQIEMDLRLEGARLPALPDPASRNLSAEHHFVLGSLCKDTAESTHWISLAQEAELTPKQLAISIKAGEVRKATPQPAGARMGFATPHAVLLAWQHFRSAVDPAKYNGDDADEVRGVFMPLTAEIKAFCALLKH